MHVSKHAGLKVPLFPLPHCGWVANGSLSRSRQRRRRSNILSFPLSCGCFPEIRGGKTCPVRRGRREGTLRPRIREKERGDLIKAKGEKDLSVLLLLLSPSAVVQIEYWSFFSFSPLFLSPSADATAKTHSSNCMHRVSPVTFYVAKNER